MTEFTVGDTVWLKSGGPKMTIARKDRDGTYVCTWFGPEQKVENYLFQGQVLTTEVPKPE